jgi:ATP-dependent RNA helicase DeaD
VHRIGRTARAGRTGKAILFVTPREERMMREIERYTRQRLTPAKVPTRADVAARRLLLFKERILKTLREEELEIYLSLVEELAEESGCDMAEIAAATACLAQGEKPLVVPLEPEPEQMPQVEDGMVRLLIDAGRFSGVRPADIVGAIANEADVPGKVIGAIDIYDDFTLVDVPAQYLEQIMEGMSGVTLRSHAINVRRATPRDVPPPPKTRRTPDERPRAARAKSPIPEKRKKHKGKTKRHSAKSVKVARRPKIK